MDSIVVKDIFEETTNPQNGRVPLTRAMAESVLGESLDNVVIYDLINNRPNRRTYNSHYVIGGNTMATNATRFKNLCAKSHVIAGRVPVAVVAKTYLQHRSMDYSNRGTAVSGKVIFYDPETKGYAAFTRGWMHCGCHVCNVAASEQALYDAMNVVVSDFRNVESFTGQRAVVARDTAKKTFWNTIVNFVGKKRSR
ncbi:MAG: hypothetical protein J6L70_02610 [Alphaproteobacteria bacterium]|nr:hypothetical protein [Alphaproteobacteria bacterium]